MSGFYSGPVADAVVRAVRDLGGVLSHEDLEQHKSVEVKPISTTYRGLTVWEVPPPNQVGKRASFFVAAHVMPWHQS